MSIRSKTHQFNTACQCRHEIVKTRGNLKLYTILWILWFLSFCCSWDFSMMFHHLFHPWLFIPWTRVPGLEVLFHYCILKMTTICTRTCVFVSLVTNSSSLCTLVLLQPISLGEAIHEFSYASRIRRVWYKLNPIPIRIDIRSAFRSQGGYLMCIEWKPIKLICFDLYCRENVMWIKCELKLERMRIQIHGITVSFKMMESWKHFFNRSKPNMWSIHFLIIYRSFEFLLKH